MEDLNVNMFKTYYLIRLDDACPTMDAKKWSRMEAILDQYGIQPMVGIIPHNEDPEQKIDLENANFWENVKEWEKKGWSLAMHGYNHCYSSDGGLNGLNPVWSRSEFAGMTLEAQREKIRSGVAIMRKNGINPKFFFAPSHTFDENTLIALKEESDIRTISDTIARKPYLERDFVFIPQQSGHPVRLPLGGYLTICYHPNTMTDQDFEHLDNFLKNNLPLCLSFNQLLLSKVKGKGLVDIILSAIYFLRRRAH